jgi:pimeloyl-ACP methyl ester carboxylesterase
VEEAADDVEDLRAALGIPEVDLLALSFGTRIGLEVIRRHPKSVHRAVFQGTVTPDGLVRFPVELDAFFRRTASDAQPQARAKGLVDDLESALRSAIKRLEHKPLSVPIETKKGNRLTVTIGPSMFRALVATRTADPNLPALLTSVARGETSVVALILQSIYRDLEGGAGSMMAHSMPCTATDGSHRLKFAGAQAPPSLVGEPFDNAVVSDAFCRQIHSYRRTRSTPIPSGDMPVLFIGGDLDDRTPVALAEAALRGFAHGRLVVAANGGHELLVDGQVQELVARFFAGVEDPQTRISLPPRTFSTVTEAAQPPRRPR